MFGHQDDQDNNQQNDGSDIDLPAIMPSLNPAGGASDLAAAQAATQAANSPVADEPKDVLSPAGGYPEAPSQRVHKGAPEPKPEPEAPKDPTPPIPAPIVKDHSLDDILKSKDDLSTIKIQALDELYPLIDKLDLTPDERFRTLMMMIQASDNQELVKAAFEAAHNISDEKTKAQALLDIVNEINYFTQNPAS
jgi:hypothetical protein